MKTTKRLVAYFGQVKASFLPGLLLYIASDGLIQLSPLFARWFMDEFIPAYQAGRYGNGDMIWTLTLYMGLLLLAGLFTYLGVRLLAFASNKVARILRNQVFDHMSKVPISYFDHQSPSQIASRMVNDTQTIKLDFYDNLVSLVVRALLSIVVTYGALFYLSPFLGLIFLSLIPIVYFWSHFYQNRVEAISDQLFQLEADAQNQVNETVENMEMIQVFAREKDKEESYQDLLDQSFGLRKAWVQLDASFSYTLSDTLNQLISLFIIAYLGQALLMGQFNVKAGLIFAVLSYSQTLFNHIHNLVQAFPVMQRAQTTAERVFELLDLPRESQEKRAFQMEGAHIELSGVTFAYEEGSPVLEDITFDLKPGQSLALVGATGSGKSSIINLLFRFYDPQEGRILIDGQDIRQVSRDSLRQDMGIVLQDPFLFTGTIASNVRLGNPDLSDQEVMKNLELVGAGPLLDKRPEGIQTPVSEKGGAFSSGERQLISFARALAADPKLLILDEATSHIDSQTEQTIQKAMKVLQKDRTSIIIAHRLSTIQDCDQILVLDKGRIVERGIHQELLDQAGYYAHLYELQSKDLLAD